MKLAISNLSIYQSRNLLISQLHNLPISNLLISNL